MRLRFGQVSFRLLIFFAVLFGIAYYVWDNSPDPVMLEATLAPTAVAMVSTATPAPTVNPRDISAQVAIEAIAPTPDIQVGYRQEIPAGISIFIPRAGIYSPVIQAYLDGTSWDISQLGTRVGHLEGTAWLDEPGNVVLSGHVEMSNGRAGVFANLDTVRLNDVIIMQTPDGEMRYTVTEIRNVPPTDLEPVMPTADNRLTLITCNSYDFISNTYLERMIIVAELQNS